MIQVVDRGRSVDAAGEAVPRPRSARSDLWARDLRGRQAPVPRGPGQQLLPVRASPIPSRAAPNERTLSQRAPAVLGPDAVPAGICLEKLSRGTGMELSWNAAGTLQSRGIYTNTILLDVRSSVCNACDMILLVWTGVYAYMFLASETKNQ